MEKGERSWGGGDVVRGDVFTLNCEGVMMVDQYAFDLGHELSSSLLDGDDRRSEIGDGLDVVDRGFDLVWQQSASECVRG